MNPYQWPPVGHDNSNDFQHLGWCYFVPPASVVQAAAPSTHNLPIATPEVQPAPQITPENSQAIALASRGESQVRQDTWSLAERRLNPPTRRVRFVEANSRLPVAEDNVPGQMDLTRASVHPANNVEVIAKSNQSPASFDEVIVTAYGRSNFYPGTIRIRILGSRNPSRRLRPH